MPGDLHSENYQLKFKNMKRNIVAVGVLLLSATLWSCSDSSSESKSLEESFQVETQSLSEAVEAIGESKGYNLIVMSNGNSKQTKQSDGGFLNSVNIEFEDVQGVYEYIIPVNEEQTSAKIGMPYKKFEKTGDSTLFVIRLPQEKAFEPWDLYEEEDGDDALDNDFEIAASDYKKTLTLDEGFGLNYKLDADLKIEEEFAGEIFMEWNISNMMMEYATEFGFANDYSVGSEFKLGNEISYEYFLKKAGEILFMEEVEFTKGEGEEEGSFEYVLTIGNIKIVKNSNSSAYEVYRDGILEEDAVITIVEDDNQQDDESGEEGEENYTDEGEHADDVFCRGGFNVKIEFADGTEVNLEDELGEETIEKLHEIFESIYDMYFVKHVVDHVAELAHKMNMQQEGGE